MQSYILSLTYYYMLTNREPLIALGSHQGVGGGGLTFFTRRTEVGGGFEHAPSQAEAVPNCPVAFYDTRSESSGILCYPVPAAGGGMQCR